jgi:4-aminobutyrate aminotransferase-like enzyme
VAISGEWSHEEEAAAHAAHGLMTWSSAGAPGIHVVRGEGVFFWDAAGKKYMDFNSMAMCSHHGHTVDPTIIEAVTHQLKTMVREESASRAFHTRFPALLALTCSISIAHTLPSSFAICTLNAALRDPTDLTNALSSTGIN